MTKTEHKWLSETLSKLESSLTHIESGLVMNGREMLAEARESLSTLLTMNKAKQSKPD